MPTPGKRDTVTGLSYSVLYRWRRAGLIKVAIVKAPGASKGVVLLDGDSLDAFLAANIAAPEAAAADLTAAVARKKQLRN